MIETMLRILVILICLMLMGISYSATVWKPLLGTSGKTSTLRLYHRFIIVTAIMLVTDGIGWVLDGREGTAVQVLLILSHTVYYVFHTIPIACYILYADCLLNRSPERTKRLGKPLWIVSGIIAAAALASPFTGWFFRIDESNVYTRGEYFIVFAVIQFVLVGFSFVPVITGKHRSNSRVYWTLVFFPTIAVIGGIVQFLFYGLVVIWPVTTVFLVAAALNIQKAQIGMDHLTGISNRMSFDEALQRYARLVNTQKPFSCIIMDLDGFKHINDTLGHDIGDRALVDTAKILKHAAGYDDVAARYGGDEFALLLPDTDERRLKETVNKIEQEVEEFNQTKRRPYALSLSMGYGVYLPEKFRDVNDFIVYIDKEMYSNKRSRQVSGSSVC